MAQSETDSAGSTESHTNDLENFDDSNNDIIKIDDSTGEESRVQESSADIRWSSADIDIASDELIQRNKDACTDANDDKTEHAVDSHIRTIDEFVDASDERNDSVERESATSTTIHNAEDSKNSVNKPSEEDDQLQHKCSIASEGEGDSKQNDEFCVATEEHDIDEDDARHQDYFFSEDRDDYNVNVIDDIEIVNEIVSSEDNINDANEVNLNTLDSRMQGIDVDIAVVEDSNERETDLIINPDVVSEVADLSEVVKSEDEEEVKTRKSKGNKSEDDCQVPQNITRDDHSQGLVQIARNVDEFGDVSDGETERFSDDEVRVTDDSSLANDSVVSSSIVCTKGGDIDKSSRLVVDPSLEVRERSVLASEERDIANDVENILVSDIHKQISEQKTTGVDTDKSYLSTSTTEISTQTSTEAQTTTSSQTKISSQTQTDTETDICSQTEISSQTETYSQTEIASKYETSQTQTYSESSQTESSSSQTGTSSQTQTSLETVTLQTQTSSKTEISTQTETDIIDKIIPTSDLDKNAIDVENDKKLDSLTEQFNVSAGSVDLSNTGTSLNTEDLNYDALNVESDKMTDAAVHDGSEFDAEDAQESLKKSESDAVFINNLSSTDESDDEFNDALSRGSRGEPCDLSSSEISKEYVAAVNYHQAVFESSVSENEETVDIVETYKTDSSPIHMTSVQNANVDPLIITNPLAINQSFEVTSKILSSPPLYDRTTQSSSSATSNCNEQLISTDDAVRNVSQGDETTNITVVHSEEIVVDTVPTSVLQIAVDSISLSDETVTIQNDVSAISSTTSDDAVNTDSISDSHQPTVSPDRVRGDSRSSSGTEDEFFLADTLDNEEYPTDLWADDQRTELDVSDSLSNDQPVRKSGESLDILNKLAWQRDVSTQTLSSKMPYESSVQEMLLRLHVIKESLSKVSSTKKLSSKQMESSANTVQEISLDIDTLQADIATKRREAEVLSTNDDVEGRDAMSHAFEMLERKVQELQGSATDKLSLLKDIAAGREKHESLLHMYNIRLHNLETWLREARISHGSPPNITHSDSIHSRQQLADVQNMNKELTRRLQELSDLSVMCDQLMEGSTEEDKMEIRGHLGRLHQDTRDLKKEMAAKEENIRELMRVCEQKRKQAEHQRTEGDLKKWFDEIRAAVPKPDSREMDAAFTEKLSSDFQNHHVAIENLTDANYKRLRDSIDQSPDRIKSTNALMDHLCGTPSQLSLPQSLINYQPQNKLLDDSTAARRITQLQDSFTELNDCWERRDEEKDEDNELTAQSLLPCRFYDSVQSMSRWLDDLELRLFNTPYESNVDTAIANNALLRRELDSLRSSLDQINSVSTALTADVSDEHSKLSAQSLQTLDTRLRVLHNKALTKSSWLKERKGAATQYRASLQRLISRLEDIGRQHEALKVSSDSVDIKLEMSERLNSDLMSCDNEMIELHLQRDRLVQDDHHATLPVHEEMRLHSLWLELQQRNLEIATNLEKSVVACSQYKKMLEEYSQYIKTALAKLEASETVSATTLEDLNTEHDSYLAYFEDMAGNYTTLNILRDRVDVETRLHYKSKHDQLDDQTRTVSERAKSQQARLQKITRQWQRLANLFNNQSSWLKGITSDYGKLANCKVRSSAELPQLVLNNRRLMGTLSDGKSNMLFLKDEERRLLREVSHPAVRRELSQLFENWSQLCSDSDRDLKRYEKMAKLWDRYEKEASDIEAWLAAAEERSKQLSKLTRTQLTEAGLMQQQRKLLELQKEVERNISRRAEVTSLCNHLSGLSLDERYFDNRLINIDERWRHLVARLSETEYHLHERQVQCITPHQALVNVAQWMDHFENELNREAEVTPRSSQDVEDTLAKFRDYKAEICHQQMMIDFLNSPAALISFSSQEPGLDESMRSELAEQVGRINQRYLSAACSTAECIKRLEMRQLQWKEYGECLNEVQKWLDEQEQKLGSFDQACHVTSVRQAHEECRDIQKALLQKKEEISHIEQLVADIIDCEQDGGEAVSDLSRTVDVLHDKWAAIDRQSLLLDDILSKLLTQYEKFNSLVNAITPSLDMADYKLSELNRADGSELSYLESQLQQIEQLKHDFLLSKPDLDQLRQEKEELFECFGAKHLSKHISDEVQEISSRWDECLHHIEIKHKQLSDVVNDWTAYESQYTSFTSELNQLESSVDLAFEQHNSLSATSEDLKIASQRLRDKLAALCQTSSQLITSTSNVVAVNLKQHESDLNQRLVATERKLNKLCTRQAKLRDEYSEFTSNCVELSDFLTHVAAYVSKLIDSGLTEQDDQTLAVCLKELSDLSLDFARRESVLERINQLAGSLRLTLDDSDQIHELNGRWRELLSSVKSKCRVLQRKLLTKQDFKEKCSDWLKFLSQVEIDQNIPLARNYETLLKQKIKYEVFESDLRSRQQSFLFILAEGNQIAANCTNTEANELRLKLNKLDDQWQSIILRINRRRANITDSLAQWIRYRAQADRLKEKLDEVEHDFVLVNADNLALEELKTQLHQWQTTKRSLMYLKPQFLELQDSGVTLMKISDSDARSMIQNDLSAIERQWLQTDNKLNQHRRNLENILSLWDDAESDMNLIFSKVKEARIALDKSLPDHYDDCEKELQYFKEVEDWMENSEKHRLKLNEKFHSLRSKMDPKDIHILQQRLQLLDSVCQETVHEVKQRQQQLREKLAKWFHFNEECKRLEELLNKMDATVSSSNGLSIEDIIHKLKTTSREELKNLLAKVETLAASGDRLSRSSSAVRANDIQDKIKQLRNRHLRLNPRLLIDWRG